MGTQVAPGSRPAPTVSFAQVRDALERVPVDRLPEVYALLLEMLEDAEDLAAVQAARAEMARTGDRGTRLEDYLRQRGITPEELDTEAL